jgi:hypothetical protein
MPSCEECKGFFPLPDDPTRGDCVTREKDERCEYWQSRPTEAMMDVGDCPRFVSRSDPRSIEELAGQPPPIVDKKGIP